VLRGICGKTLGTWLKLVVITLTVAAVTALPGDLGLASAAVSTVDEFARVRLTSTDPMRRFRADVVLRLHISEQGESSFQADTQVEGDGLDGNMLYDMLLVSTGSGHGEDSILIDSDRADEECERDDDTGEEIDCEEVLDLRGRLAQAPFDVTTMEGLTINIEELLFGREGTRSLLLTGTVTESDIREMSR